MPDSLSTLFSLPALLGNYKLGDIAARLGEPEQSVRQGLESIVGATLNGLVSRSGESGTMREVVDLASKAPADGPLPTGNTLDANSPALAGGKRLISALLGGGEGSAANAAGAASGLRSSAIPALTGVAGALVLGALGKQVRNGGLTATSLAEMLQREGLALRGSYPAAANEVPSAARTITTERVDRDPVVAESVIKEKKSSFWLWLIPLALILLGLLWYFMRDRTATTTETTQTPAAPTDTSTQAPAPAPAPAATTTAALGAFVKRQLPDNVELNVPEHGVEAGLLAFIQDSSKPVDKTSWFDFDRLVFATGATTLEPQSEEQLKNIAAILKAYPHVHIKVGGYTDNTGDAQQNQKLSQGRAESVVTELTGMGIAANRLTAQGYGEDHPVGDNSTDEGRAKNRRVSMLVTRK